MTAIYRSRRRGMTSAFRCLLLSSVCAFATACASPSDQGASSSYQAAAIEASQNGDQKEAVKLAEKEVARFSAPGQCSGSSTLNCGTLALAYGSLAQYQIMSGDRKAGERSFHSAQDAIGRMAGADRPSAIGMVYHDVSEAYWKTGDRERAVAVFKEGRAAGGDSWIYFASAATVADREWRDRPSVDERQTETRDP